MIIGGAKLFKLLLSRCLGYGAFHRLYVYTVFPWFLEARFADVTFPAYRVSFFYRLPDVEHQLVERKVQIGIVHPVIGNLERKVFSVRMMRETGERYILLGIAYAVGKLLRGIFGTQHVYGLGRHVAYFCVKQVVQFLLELADARFLRDGAIAQFLHLAAEHLVVHVLRIFIAVVRLCTILIYIMYQHRGSTAQADVLLSLCKVIFQCLFFQHHAGYVGDGEIHGIPLHDVLAFDGGKHAVCPAEFAVALVLDGRSTDQVDMLRKIILASTCLWDTGSLLSVSAAGEYKQSESYGYNVLSFHAAKIQKRF